MADAGLAKKLRIKPGHRVLVLQAPNGYIERLGAPDGGEMRHRARGLYDVAQVFATAKADAERLAPKAMKALKSHLRSVGGAPIGA